MANLSEMKFFLNLEFFKKKISFCPYFFSFDPPKNVFTYSESEKPGLSPGKKIVKIGVGALCLLPFWKFQDSERGSLNKIFQKLKNYLFIKMYMKNDADRWNSTLIGQKMTILEPFLAYPENSWFWEKNLKMAPQAQGVTQSQKMFRPWAPPRG